MAQPKCPECGTQGLDHIVSEESAAKSQGGDAWFEVAYCDQCGHVYGVFAKHVLNHEVKIFPSITPPRI